MKYTGKKIGKAIKKLAPGARFDVVGNSLEGIHWLDDKKEKPSDSSIIKELEAQEIEFKNKQYQRDRADAYPSWQTQMDLLYHGGIDALKAELKKTKDKYPKP